MAQLAEERDDLATMIGGMVDEMAKHLPERVYVFAAAGRLYQPCVIEPILAQPGHEPPPLHLDRLPAPAHLGQRFEVGALGDGGIRSLQPAMQPQLLRPHDVGERAVNPAVAALQVAEILLLRHLGGGVEDRAVRPGVVVEELEEFVQSWQQVDAQQASVDEAAVGEAAVGEATVNCGCVSPTFTTKTSQR